MPLTERPKKVKCHVFKEPIRVLRSTLDLAELKQKKTVSVRKK
jgi:hypothetical protein